MITMRIEFLNYHKNCNIYIATIWQIAIVFCVFWASRFAFYLYNRDLIGNIEFWRVIRLGIAGIRFDFSALAAFNAFFILLRFLPFSFVYNRKYILATNLLFLTTNSILLLLNIIDIPLYRFVGTRMKLFMLAGYLSDSGTFGLIIDYFKSYWWLYITAIIVLIITFKIAFIPIPTKNESNDYRSKKLIIVKSIICVFACFITFLAFYGKSLTSGKITTEFVAHHLKKATEAQIILNTPFTILDFSENQPSIQKFNFYTEEQLKGLRNSLHVPDSSSCLNRKNIVLISLESGAAFFSNTLNPYNRNPKEQIMPFLDSLILKSTSVKHTMATGTLTIDGMNAIHIGIPSYLFLRLVLSEYANTAFDSPASLLAAEGYTTKFYYGGYRNTFTIDKLARMAGFEDITDLKDYPFQIDENNDDGIWGVYDHVMAEWSAKDINNLRQPFLVSWHTLNPHTPFKLPKNLHVEKYTKEEGTLGRAMEYVDLSLRRFFETAHKQPWFNNTIFIITSDHGERDLGDSPYMAQYLQPHIIFAVYDPSGEIKPGVYDKVMSQFDIAPTILGLAGYNKPYVALGNDVFSPQSSPYAIDFVYRNCHITSLRYAVCLDGNMERLEGVYDITTDPLLEHPLKTYDRKEVERMITWGRALMQDYSQRMDENRMSIKTDKANTPRK